MKALFIPLKTEYFNAFKAGTKDCEIRVEGPRWNNKTCYLGREVTLSKGYGKYERMSRVISRTHAGPARILLNEQHQAAMIACYGPDVLDRRVIKIYFTELNS